MKCNCNEIIEFIEKEMLFVEEMLELLVEDKILHRTLHAKRDSYKRVLEIAKV